MSDTIAALEPEVVGTQLAQVEQQAGLDQDAALALRGQFADYYNIIVEWRGRVDMITDETDPVQQKAAREIRLGLRAVRCDVERLRKTLKEESLRRGRAVDGFSHVLKYLCEPIETRLLEIEQHAERQEAARIAALTEERTAALVAVDADPSAYNLGAMDEDTFRLVLEGETRKRDERVEAERKAEADRVAREKAEADERERMRVENERLKKEAVKRDAAAKKEREKAEAERAKEREAATAKHRELEAKATAEREAREKAERDAAAVKAKEAKRVAAENAAKKKAARAPDRDKLLALAVEIGALAMPAMATDEGRVVMADVMAKRDGFVTWIEARAEAL